MDFYAGNDKGRIYLITPANYDRKNYKKPNLSTAESIALVELLAHPNAWWRTTAQRLIVERQDKTVIDAVRKLLQSNTEPYAKLRAIYTLDGLDALTTEDVTVALKDKEPGVREHAIMLAERFPALATEIVKAIDDSAKYVAFQAVLSAGNLSNDKAFPALAHALDKYSADSLFAVAVLTSKPGINGALLPILEKAGYFKEDGKFKQSYIISLAYASGLQDDAHNISALTTFLSSPDVLANAEWEKSVINGLIRGIKASKRTKHSAVLMSVLKKLGEKTKDEDLQKLLAAF